MVRPVFLVPLVLLGCSESLASSRAAVEPAPVAKPAPPSLPVVVPTPIEVVPTPIEVVPVEEPVVPVVPVEPTAEVLRHPGVIQDCDRGAGYKVSSFENPAVDGRPTLWLTSLYESRVERPGPERTMGRATVRVEAPGAHILAFSAYEPMVWDIEVGPDSKVEQILLWGYHDQYVTGVKGVKVRDMNGPSCGYSWPYNNGGCDTAELVATVEAAVGQPIQRFEGCYRASELIIQP
ncbi:MAG: hypothetical protein KC656_10670 [Myxococcales bacterium]|nr:hypothetical protein [Myxococcales bacterium]